MHIYIDKNGDISNVRAYTDKETKYITLFSKNKGKIPNETMYTQKKK